MKSVFYFIPLFLVVLVPGAFAQVETTTGENYNLVENFNTGEATWQSHPNRIMDGTWKNYVLENNADKVIFNSNSIGSFVYDKNSCSYSIYDNGFVSAQTQIIPSVSSVATYNNGAWSNMDVNNSSCDVTVTQNEDSVFLTSTKILNEDVTTSVNGTTVTNTIQKEKFVQTINLDINKGIKETFYIYDDSNTENQLGISQTVHVGETITLGGQTINIAELNGMSFDKQYIIDNQAEILQLTNEINYDFDTGIKSLSNVNIIHDSGFLSNTYKVNLDYANGNNGVPFVGYLEIDPTFGYTSGTMIGAYSTSGCAGPGTRTGPYVGYDPGGPDCYTISSYWDITSIDDTATITNVNVRYDIAGKNGAQTCDWISYEGTASTDSTATRFTDALGGTTFVTGDANCSTVANNYVIDLGTSADTDLQNELSVDNEWAVSTSGTIKSGANSATFGTTIELQVTWAITTIPDPPTGLTTTTGIPLGTSWTAPVDDGGSSLTGYKVFRSLDSLGTTPTLVGSPTITSFDDNTVVGGTQYYFSVQAVNAVGSSAYLTPWVSGLAGTPWNVPQNLLATISDANATPLLINLSWDASIQGSATGTLTGYELFNDGVSIGTVGLVTSSTHQLSAPGTANLTIKSLSTHGNSATGSITSITTPTVPGISTLTTAINNPDTAPLTITSTFIPGATGGSSITGHNLYYSSDDITFNSIATNVNTNFSYTVSASGTHYFKSEAINNVGTGPLSVSHTITTPTVPSAITDLSGSPVSDVKINLSWSAPSDGGSNIDLYKIFKDGVQVDTTTNLTYSLTGLSSNTAYAITVFSNNSVGDSLVSNSVSITTYQSVSGSITITKTTVGATSKLEFTSTSTGTPTPNFNSFTLKEGATVLASGISTPYYLALNDGNPHTYTISSYDGTHWSTPTISGTVTETSAYSPTWNNNVSYNYTRASGVMDLTVNRDSQVLWDASCNYKTTAQVMNDEAGITSTHNSVWNISESQSISDISTVYVSCTDGGTTLFSFTSFGPNRLGGGIAQLNDTFDGMIGTPVALIFVLLVAGLFTGRSAPTGILLVLALVGVLGFVGMLAIEEAIWGFLLLAGVLGIFLGKRFL